MDKVTIQLFGRWTKYIQYNTFIVLTNYRMHSSRFFLYANNNGTTNNGTTHCSEMIIVIGGIFRIEGKGRGIGRGEAVVVLVLQGTVVVMCCSIQLTTPVD